MNIPRKTNSILRKHKKKAAKLKLDSFFILSTDYRQLTIKIHKSDQRPKLREFENPVQHYHHK
jgi:hypothetical protein